MINIRPLEVLIADLREDATRLRQYGAEGQATAVEQCADRLGQRLAEWFDERLSLRQAAHELDLTTSAIQKRARSGKLPNVGRKGRPEFRRRDLYGAEPMSRPEGPRTSSGMPDLAAEVIAARLAS